MLAALVVVALVVAAAVVSTGGLGRAATSCAGYGAQPGGGYGYSFDPQFGYGCPSGSTSTTVAVCRGFGALPCPEQPPSGWGYCLSGADGGLFCFGDTFSGSLGGRPLNAPIVASERGRVGYYLFAADGGVFAFGGALFRGSMGGRPLNSPIVAGRVTDDGAGYWLVAADGGVFAFGSAQYYGSMGGRRLNAPIVGMAPATSSQGYFSFGAGYWLVAADGGVFSFGTARFYGSMGGRSLNQPIVAMDASPDGSGYWFVAGDGGVFAFNADPISPSAGFYGSTGGTRLNSPVTAFRSTPTGKGYLLVAKDGGVFSFGDAIFFGSTGGTPLNGPIVGISMNRFEKTTGAPDCADEQLSAFARTSGSAYALGARVDIDPFIVNTGMQACTLHAFGPLGGTHVTSADGATVWKYQGPVGIFLPYTIRLDPNVPVDAGTISWNQRGGRSEGFSTTEPFVPAGTYQAHADVVSPSGGRPRETPATFTIQ